MLTHKLNRLFKHAAYLVLLQVGFVRLTPYDVTGELLPRRFTLISPEADGLFSVTLSVIPILQSEYPSVRRYLALGVRTFLPVTP